MDTYLYKRTQRKALHTIRDAAIVGFLVGLILGRKMR